MECVCITSIFVHRGNILIFTEDKEKTEEVFGERGKYSYFSKRFAPYFGKKILLEDDL